MLTDVGKCDDSSELNCELKQHTQTPRIPGFPRPGRTYLRPIPFTHSVQRSQSTAECRRIVALEAGLQTGVSPVSLDKSLKRGNRLARARNVLKRHERIEKLTNEDRWDESKSVLGLPKTKVPKSAIGKRKKKKTEDEDEEAEVASTD